MALPLPNSTRFATREIPSRFAVRQILQAFLPGGPAVVDLIGQVHDGVQETSVQMFAWDAATLPPVTAGEREQAGQILEVLTGELATLVAQVAVLETFPEAAVPVLEATLAADSRCQEAALRLDQLAQQSDRLGQQNRRLLRAQGYSEELVEKLLLLLRRVAGVGDLVQELQAAGIEPVAFRGLLRRFQEGARALGAGDLPCAVRVFVELEKERPDLATVAVALAAAQAAAHHWRDAEQALARAVSLRPSDPELARWRDWVGQVIRQGEQFTRDGAPPTADGRNAPAPAKVLLEVIAGPHQGARFVFDHHDTFLVGRAASAHLQLIEDAYFSRHHFLLEFNPPRCYLRDLGSRNGTQLNGRKVADGYLQDGDVISGGKTRIRYSLMRAAEPATSGDVIPLLESEPIQAEATRPPPASAPGPSVPGYELLRVLGRGGMGVVYSARRHATGQLCALKLILPESAASEPAMQRFLREISVLSQLDHPRIVRFHETGICQGQFFFAMENVETVDVPQQLARASEAERRQAYCTIACQALEGLSYAHARGFIHRDIKPANLLVSHQDQGFQAKLADFGLAKNFEGAGFSGMTHDGQVCGTPIFMAPEQILNARLAKPAVDLYSVAATLYYLLAQRAPYDFDQRKDRLVVILEDPPVPLTRFCPAAPAGLAELVHRALAKDPADRFPSAEAMRQALLPFTGSAVTR